MSAGRTIAYIAAAILILFGVLTILGAFSSTGSPTWLISGSLLVGIGFVMIWLVSRRKAASDQPGELVQKIELSGDIELETLKCQNCGGTLSSEHIQVVAGAPMVNCPYCKSAYQLTEEPKW
jgi:hypothetical protein